MKKLSKETAERLKAAGYTHITAIVRRYYFTNYVKCEPIEQVAKYGRMSKTARSCKGYTVGINENHIPAEFKCIRYMDAVNFKG